MVIYFFAIYFFAFAAIASNLAEIGFTEGEWIFPTADGGAEGYDEEEEEDEEDEDDDEEEEEEEEEEVGVGPYRIWLRNHCPIV